MAIQHRAVNSFNYELYSNRNIHYTTLPVRLLKRLQEAHVSPPADRLVRLLVTHPASGCLPGVLSGTGAELASRAGISLRQYRKLVAELEEKGVVEQAHKVLLIPCLHSADLWITRSLNHARKMVHEFVRLPTSAHSALLGAVLYESLQRAKVVTNQVLAWCRRMLSAWIEAAGWRCKHKTYLLNLQRLLTVDGRIGEGGQIGMLFRHGRAQKQSAGNGGARQLGLFAQDRGAREAARKADQIHRDQFAAHQRAIAASNAKPTSSKEYAMGVLGKLAGIFRK